MMRWEMTLTIYSCLHCMTLVWSWDNLYQRDVWHRICIVPWPVWPCSDCQITSHLQLCNTSTLSRSQVFKHYLADSLYPVVGIQILFISGNVSYVSFVGSKVTWFLICLHVGSRNSLERKNVCQQGKRKSFHLCVSTQCAGYTTVFW